MRTLNVRLLIVLVVAVTLISGGVWALHRFQVKRNSHMLLVLAKEAREQGELQDAARHFRRYLVYKPDDQEALVGFAMVLTDIGEIPTSSTEDRLRAYDTLEKTLRAKPGLTEVRTRLARYAFRLQRFDIAIAHFEELLKNPPKDLEDKELSQIRAQLGAAYEFNEDLEKARTLYETMIAEHPHSVSGYVALANMLNRRLEEPAKADEVINQMVTANEGNAKAFLERSRFNYSKERKVEGTPEAEKLRDQIDQDIARALELDPNDKEVLMAASQLAGSMKDFDKSREYLNRVLKGDPKDIQAASSLAQLDWAENKRDDAIRRYEDLGDKNPDNPEIPWALSDFYLQNNNSAKARTTLDDMRKRFPMMGPSLDYLDGRILVADRKYRQALTVFERVRPMLPDTSTSLRIDLLMAECYYKLGQLDMELDCYNRALLVDPLSFQVRRLLGAAYARAKRTEDALRELEPLVDRDPQIKALVMQLKTAQAGNSPEEIEKIIQGFGTEEITATGENKPSSQLWMVKIDLLISQGKLEEAQKLAESERDKDPKKVGPWIPLAMVALRRGGEKDGLKQGIAVLDEGLKQIDPHASRDAAVLHQVRIDFVSSLPAEEAKPMLEEEQRFIDSQSEEHQAGLLDKLGQAYARQRDNVSARKAWLRLSQLNPDDNQLQLRLFGLALESQDEKTIDEDLARIAKDVGEDSALYLYCQAARIITKKREKGARPTDDELAEVRDLLDRAAEVRPNWYMIYSMQGDVEWLSNNSEAAIVKYQDAVQNGERDPQHIRNLVQLLMATQRYDEAKETLEVLKKAGGEGADTQKIATLIDQRTGNFKQALGEGEAVLANSKVPGELIWYAQLLTENSDYDKAIEILRKAIALDDKKPDGWIAMIGLLVRTGKSTEAEQVVDQAKAKMDPELAPLALAQCYEILGKSENAEAQYLAALKAKPEDVRVLRQVSLYFLRVGKNDAAAEYLQQMLAKSKTAPEPDRVHVAWARRQMARLKSETGNYRMHLEALAMVDGNAIDGKLAYDDLALKADILSQRTDRGSTRQAVSTLEMARDIHALTARDQLLLARLYDRMEEWDKARDEMVQLITQTPENLELERHFVQMLLRHGEITDATSRVEKMVQQDPNSSLTVESKARLMVAQGKPADAVVLLEGLIPRPLPPRQNGLLRQVATLMVELAEGRDETESAPLYAAADRLLTELVENDPSAVLVRATFLGQHGDLDQCLQICESAQGTLPIQQCIDVALGSFRRRLVDVKPEQFKRVDGWIAKVGEQVQDPSVVEFMTADLRDMEGKHDEAVRLYRQILTRKGLSEPQSVAALNNLAFMVAVRDNNGNEALPLIERAINIAGPLAELLDTRAMANLASGKADKALTDLNDAVAVVPDKTKYFHLAIAYLKAKDNDQAIRAFIEARKLGLRDAEVSALERPSYQELKKLVDAQN